MVIEFSTCAFEVVKGLEKDFLVLVVPCAEMKQYIIGQRKHLLNLRSYSKVILRFDLLLVLLIIGIALKQLILELGALFVYLENDLMPF